MTLPLPDKQYLTDRQINHEVVSDSGMTCVVFPGWRLPPGLSAGEADVLSPPDTGLSGHSPRHVVGLPEAPAPPTAR